MLLLIPCCVYLFLGKISVAQNTTSLTTPKIVNYTIKDYGSEAQNFSIIQNSRGIIYVANVGGLLEYDGNEWRKISPNNHQVVMSLAINSEDQVFVGGMGEFGRLIGKGHALDYESLSENLPDSVQDFSLIRQTIELNSKVYFNARKYIFVWDGQEISIIHSPYDDINLFKIGAEIWVSSAQGGLFRLKGRQLVDLPHSNQFINRNVVGIQPFMKNKWLIANREGDLLIYDTNEDHMVVPFAEDYRAVLGEGQAFGLSLLNDGNYVVNTLQNGLFIFNKDQAFLRHISRSQGLQNSSVIGVFEDQNNQLWCALDNGISIIKLSSKFGFSYEGEQFFGAVEDLEIQGDHFYMSTRQGLFKANLQDSVPRFSPYSQISRTCLDIQAYDSSLLVCSDKLYQIQNDQLIIIDSSRNRTVKPIASRAHHVIAGGIGGLHVFKQVQGQWVQLYENTQFPDEIYEINQIESSQSFWVNTLSQGVFKVKFTDDYQEAFVEKIKDELLADDARISLISYQGKTLFSQKNRLLEYNTDNDSFEETDVLEKLQGKFIFKFAHTNEDVWVSSGRRFFHLKEDELDSSAFSELKIGGFTAILPLPDGSCYIGGDEALIYYDQNKVASSDPFYCNIRRILNRDSLIFNGVFSSDNGFSYEQADVPVFEYDRNAVTFYFSAAWYGSNDVTYSYQLVSYDDSYSAWTAETKKEYTNLPPGDYTFRVKAKNSRGEESLVAEYKFTIKTPWYMTWWAYALFIALGVLLIGLILYLYSRKLRNDKKRLEQIVQERTVELDEKNQKLEEKNKDITDSIRYAEKIQSAILTSEDYLSTCFQDFHVVYRPKDILSGDFYWAFNVKTDTEDKLIWMTADCTGHGVPGSLMSMLGNSFMNEIVIENGITQPDIILNMMREHIINALNKGNMITRDGMDVALCCYDNHTGILQYSGAKNPLWVVRTEGDLPDQFDRKLIGDSAVMYEWRADNMPVGFSEQTDDFTLRTIKLEKNDLLVTFSDGFADQFGGPKNRKIQQKTFKTLVLEHANLPAKQIGMSLENYFDEWRGDQEQIDDVCVFVVKHV